MSVLTEALGIKGFYTEIKPSPIHGMGVFALRKLYKGDIGVVEGYLMPSQMATVHSVYIDEDTVLEPYPPYRFLNHDAVNYNAELIVDPDEGVWIALTRDIEPGEEITIHYGEDWDNAEY